MYSYQELIDFLFEQMQKHKSDSEEYKKFMSTIRILKKEIPIRPIKSKETRYGMGYEYHDWICPICGKFLAYEPEACPSRCRHCGQRIGG